MDRRFGASCFHEFRGGISQKNIGIFTEIVETIRNVIEHIDRVTLFLDRSPRR